MIAALPAARLCLVTDRRRLARACDASVDDASSLLVAQARAAGAAGIGTIQLRERDLDGDALYALAAAIRAVIGPETTLLVNDRADVAAAVRAGVHLRESSMPAARVRMAFPALRPLWRAVHDEAGVAAAGAVDALVAGTVQATASKPDGGARLGPDGLRAIVHAATAPVYAIGGLAATDWPWLAPLGVHGVAAIGTFLPRSGESIAAAIARATASCAVDVD
ncbi:MAG: thiamine phosphate synthase [Vicinamibacterales bacterium]